MWMSEKDIRQRMVCMQPRGGAKISALRSGKKASELKGARHGFVQPGDSKCLTELILIFFLYIQLVILLSCIFDICYFQDSVYYAVL